MFKNSVAVLDIGSSYISLFVGEESVNGTFAFRAKEVEEYNTFYDGEFSDVKETETIIAELFRKIYDNSPIASISRVFVGVPGEFIKTVSKNYKITFSKPKRITEQDVDSLFNLGYEALDDGYTLINRSAVYYSLGNVKTHNPIGANSISLAGRLSYVYTANYFKEVIDGILSKVGVKDVLYLSVDLAENLYLFSGEGKDVCRILVDVGYTTTSVSISSGNGLLYNSAIADGGGVITAYLSEELECDFFVAETLKRKINLGLRDNPDATYVITDRFDEEYSFSRNQVNDIVRRELDCIAERIDKALSLCALKIPSDVEVYFTGGGICYMRGAVEYVASRLNSYPNIVAPKIPHYDKPSKSSEISLISVAIKYKNDKIFFIS